MKSLTVEIAALTISYKNAETAARAACK